MYILTLCNDYIHMFQKRMELLINNYMPLHLALILQNIECLMHRFQ
jgi:hypothetical protein